MNKSQINSIAPTPSPEEIEFYIRKGKQLQSEAVHAMLKSSFRVVIKAFSAFSADREQPGEKAAAPLSGHHMHGS